MNYRFGMILLSFLLSPVAASAAGVGAGQRLAHQWCSNCHIIGQNQTGSVPQGPPSFRSIARSGMSTNQLRTFLSHPHGSMPDSTLTRFEIHELIGYIRSLR